MQVTITRRNTGLSESLKNYLEGKLSVLTKRYGKIIDANVVMDNEGKEHSVETVSYTHLTLPTSDLV